MPPHHSHSSSRDHGSSPFRHRSYHLLPPRPLSARLRGESAPRIRTSLSPDRILRSRRRRRRGLQGDQENDVISIASDSEVGSVPPVVQPRRVPASAHSQRTWLSRSISTASTLVAPGTQPVFVDLTELPKDTPRASLRIANARGNVYSGDRTAADGLSPSFNASGQHDLFAEYGNRYTPTPPWLRVALSKLRKEFPEFTCQPKCTTARDGAAAWHIICVLCAPEKSVEAGPGQSLDKFRLHLSKVHFLPLRPSRNRDPSPDARPSHSRARNPPHARTPQASPRWDVVELFLVQQGLSTALAPALRAQGITDLARMRKLGQMSESALDKLDRRLDKAGIDFCGRLLIVEGLRQLAQQK